MKAFFKQNNALVLAFVLPVLLIVGVALATYLPGLFFTTHYNFLYATCPDTGGYYSYNNCGETLTKQLTVVDGKLVINPVKRDTSSINEDGTDIAPLGHIFLHDTNLNESREVTPDEAKGLQLSSLVTSPEGVAVIRNNTGGSGDYFFLFSSRASYGYSLVKGKQSSKLNLIERDRYAYDNDFHFVGWVIPSAKID